VVELASPRGVSALRQKMASYQANGARLGWLLLRHDRRRICRATLTICLNLIRAR
jgi:hypothetical protein